ncbi:MAG TPA: Crp/Fnr family transcriptional regulator [Candidatus Saccharimonadales bacterium]|nr:Crp/Fnr family transcriptional regulator [Candidatus Saccharimonadales bacterium]
MPRKLPKGQLLIYEGDPIDHLYYIVSGYVKVYSIMISGSERTIFIYGPGDLFPFTSYLTSSSNARYFYECMTEVEIYAMTPANFEKKVRGNFTIGEALVHYTNMVSQQFLARIDVLSVNDARRKIIALLAFLIDKCGDGGNPAKICVPLTTQDIANMCGLTRETASVQLSKLRKAGVISGTRNLIINVAKLEKLKPQLAIAH